MVTAPSLSVDRARCESLEHLLRVLEMPSCTQMCESAQLHPNSEHRARTQGQAVRSEVGSFLSRIHSLMQGIRSLPARASIELAADDPMCL